MKKTLTLPAMLLLSTGLSFAQYCHAPEGGAFLHGNNVRAYVNSGGNLFVKGNGASFQIHGTEPAHAIFAQGLWLGALDAGGNLKLAAQTYGLVAGQTDYYAGPLNESGATDAESCRNWDRVWTVLRHQIEAHIADFDDDGLIDDFFPEILEWPGKGNPYFSSFTGFELPDAEQGLAPFFDRDGDGLYDPLAGDYPMPPRTAVIPEQITWSIFNDAGGLHLESFGNPLHIEVQLTTWALQCADNAQPGNTVFTSYKVINRSAEPLDSLYFGLWVDFDLGCMTDDGIGSVPALNTAFVYNLDNEDGLNCYQNSGGYGPNPPVQAFTVLNKSLAYTTYCLNSSAPGGAPPALADPSGPTVFYRFLTGRCGDGMPFTFGGTGYDPSLSSPVVQFVFPGDPNDPAQWSDLHHGQGTGDRRVIGSLLIEGLPPGGLEEVDAAYSYFREPGADHLGNVTAMYEGIENLHAWYASQFEVSCTPKPACEEDCIWAGDLNADGIANHYDLLDLALGLNRHGPARSAPYNWSPQAGGNWPAAQHNGANGKHLDADGDGIATFDDFRFTTQHYNFTRPGYQPVAKYREGPELQLVADAPFFVDFSNLAAGQGIAIGVIQLATAVPELFGLAYTLEYDTAYFEAIYGAGYSNPDGHVVFQPRNSSRALPGDSNYARVDTAGTIVQGELEKLLIKVKEAFLYPLPADTTLIRFKNIKAIRSDGTEIEIGGTTVVARFPGIAAAAEGAIADQGIRLFPNPTDGRLELRFPGQQVEGIEVFDATGRRAWQQQGRLADAASLELQNLPGGIYFVRLWLEGAIVVRRVLLVPRSS